ncbi:polyhydroxyalkanoate depolymerase [uncultured Maritimibacter sp.]|jgi:poly(3-hydroxybutyrate) depolymerase|uniref:polyhydroxyalkanoate depolymerase n=1 Tax=uncultured Maritimibacter sp. TaxID=991866 RepID=UPI000AAF686D|nr:polyhydroxyalkanoate depolymerase [uncultured Maritimibacter sp.]
MRYLPLYDLTESVRITNQWLGATAQAIGSSPGVAMIPNPYFQWLRGWGEVTERSFSRMVAKPDWGIHTVVGAEGRDHVVRVERLIKKPFGDLIHFHVQGRKPLARRVLLVAPMSGHYATLLRSTVASLLPDAEVYITDWHNARDIPVSEGKFDIEDYTLYLVDFMRHLGPDINVVAVCQPAPLTLAATAYLAAEDPEAQPQTLTLIGGPIDPSAAATDVTDFGDRVAMDHLEATVIQSVGFKYRGAGRLVYPGIQQLTSFMTMNAEKHTKAFNNQIMRAARGEASDHDKHNKFYDEYLAVMDMTAEFYLTTVDRIFKEREIARNVFEINGKRVDIGAITNVAVKTVEGEKDDISAPGQCLAALELCTGLPDEMKAQHLEPGAGHYGIFAGKSWRDNIRPLVLAFMDEHAGAHEAQAKKKRAPRAVKTDGKPALKAV